MGGVIPKRIHQTAPTARLPPRWAAFQRTVRRLHPDCEYRLWTDGDNFEFVHREFPEHAGMFDSLPRNIMRADVIRYMLMERIGGIYLDCDYEFLRPFDLWDHALVLPVSRSAAAGDDVDRLGNCVFASEPGHPFWRRVLAELAARPPGREADVEEATGPNFLTRIWGAATPAERAGVLTPARSLFHPPTPKSPAERARIVADGAAYGIHYCDGTWRRPRWAKKVKRWFSKRRDPTPSA